MPSKPPPGKRIQPGERRNPRGSSAKARARAAIRRMTADDLADLTSLLFTSDRTKINEVANDPKSTFMQILTAKLLVDCYKKGDVSIYRPLVGQVVGPQRQRHSHEVTGKDGGPIRTATQTEAEMLAELAQLEAARKQLDEH